MIIELLLGTLQVVFGRFEMKRGPIGCAGFLRNGDRLARIAHFLDGRRGLTGGGDPDRGDQECLHKRFKSGSLHDLFLLQQSVQRYQQAALVVKRRQSR